MNEIQNKTRQQLTMMQKIANLKIHINSHRKIELQYYQNTFPLGII